MGNVSAEVVIALRALVDTYALACDRRDGALLTSLFVPDAALTVHWPDGRSSALRAPDDMAGVPKTLSRYDQTFHFVGNHLVSDLEGDLRAGDAYCMAHHLHGDTDTVMAIHYQDQYARTDGAWRFARRDVRIRWITDQPINAS